MRPIDRYAAIGDCRSVALVSDEGAVDWLCWPRVDSSAWFAALLDDERGGSCRVAPIEPFTSTRSYIEGTNVLVTTMRTLGGVLELTDAMPVGHDRPSALTAEREIIRRARCIEGTIDLAIQIDARPGWGIERARANAIAGGACWDARNGSLFARCDLPLVRDGSVARGGVRLTVGAQVDLSLSHAVDARAVMPALGERIDEALAHTTSWWQSWARRMTYSGAHHGEVQRSALALKLLCYAPPGAIIAAPTTSLPERLFGALNWDYRFCWLRDASMTARALFGLGYVEEASAFVSWLLHATRLSWPS